MFQYNGQLNQNLISKSIFNMIISQRVFDISLATPKLANYFKVDGTLYGDTKLYYSMDVGASITWADVDKDLSPDRLAPNLLDLNRNHSIVAQSITMGIYKYVPITIGRYLEKQAFTSEGSFSTMIGVMTSSLNEIKKVYDNALINYTIGTHVSQAAVNTIKIKKSNHEDVEARNRLDAQNIARELVVLKANLEDNSRDYNELGYLRSYGSSNLMAVWNVEQKAKITKMDLPTIFHNSGIGDTGFTEVEIPARWFGNINTGAKNAASNVRFSKNGWFDVSGATAVLVDDYAMLSDADKKKCLHFNEGDLMPAVGEYYDAPRKLTVNVVSTKFAAGDSYTVDPDILFVLVDRESLPFMSGFRTGTEFWNPLSLTTNHYLIFGHNKLEFLKDKPFIRVMLED